MLSFPHTLRLILGGFLSLPALLLLLLVSPLVAILSLPALSILIRRKPDFLLSFPKIRPLTTSSSSSSSSATTDVVNKNNDVIHPAHPQHPLLQHAVITGGSSGIGLSIAKELARLNCRHVTLIARREDQLQVAKTSVEHHIDAKTADGQPTGMTSVHVVSVDVTDAKALEEAALKLITSTVPSPGPPTLLFNCAGYAIPLAFQDLTPADFVSQVNVNYLGSVNVVRAFLPYMLRGMGGTNGNNENNTGGMGGNIILTSSMSGQLGTYGYSSYSPTKFALRGFAECLSMELAALSAQSAKSSNGNVNISVAYPPDTNTPGYKIENEKKPEACRLISESSGIWDAGVVANKIVNSSLAPNPPFDIYFGIDGWMLSTLCAGMNPVTSLLDAVCQVSLMGLLRFVSLFYLLDFGRITQGCHRCESDEVSEGNGRSGKNDGNRNGAKNGAKED